MQLVEAYHHLDKQDALFMRIQFLIKSHLFSRAASLLENGYELPDHQLFKMEWDTKDKLSVCTRILSWIFERIEWNLNKESNDSTIPDSDVTLLLSCSTLFVDILIKLDSQKKIFGLCSLDIYNLSLICQEFSLLVTPSEYRSVESKNAILRNYISKNIQKSCPVPMDMSLSCNSQSPRLLLDNGNASIAR